MNIKKFLVSGAAAALMFGTLAVGAFASTETIYNNIPDPLPGNLVSQAFEAQSASEFGGQIQFAGTLRSDPKVTVVMSSWGCGDTGHWYTGDCVTTPGETFSLPITLNIYNVGSGNSVGSLISTKTQTFNIPFRPSASNVCGDGRWSDGTTCFNGFATPISFDLTGLTLPSNVIVSVAYNTTHFGYSPIGESALCYSSATGCGYDSLNVGVTAPPNPGTDPQPDSAYLNSSWTGAYCDNGAGGVGTFRFDTGCWNGYQPAIRVDAQGKLNISDQCKNNAWKTFTNPSFKNQGDCVSWFQSNPHAIGNRKDN